MSIKYPKTICEYYVQPIKGRDTYKVVRYKFLLLGPKATDKKLIKTSTLLNQVGKNIAEDFVFKKDRNIK